MKKTLILATIALLVGSTQSFAQNAPKKKKPSLHDQLTGQGYGTAGCGLGSIVFGEAPGLIQVVAVTLNSTGVQTFGITSGTSNCGESGKVAQAHDFIQVNQVALENDLARGNGETVASLSEVMGCKNADFTSTLKQKYQVGISTAQLEQVAVHSCKL